MSHHNALLIGWADLEVLQRGVHLYAASCQYSTDEAEQARETLRTTWGWRFTDGGRRTE